MLKIITDKATAQKAIAKVQKALSDKAEKKSEKEAEKEAENTKEHLHGSANKKSPGCG